MWDIFRRFDAFDEGIAEFERDAYPDSDGGPDAVDS
jgi:hypothetical protein